jgi:general secretion pathway protein D
LAGDGLYRNVCVFGLGAAVLVSAAWVGAAPPGQQPANNPDASPQNHGATIYDGRTRDQRKQIKLNYVHTAWPKVLKDVADAADLTLVMEDIPPGHLSRLDREVYTTAEALRVLNRQLEPKGFRLLEQKEYLVVLHLENARNSYRRPIIRADESEPQSVPDTTPEFRKPQWDVQPITSRADDRRRAGDSDTARMRDSIRQVSGSGDDRDEDEGPSRLVPVRLKNRNATDVARAIYRAYKTQAELIDDGPQGLPAFRVYEAEQLPASPTPMRVIDPGIHRRVQFTVGLDDEWNNLVVEATDARIRDVGSLIQRLDTPANQGDEVLKIVSSKKNVRAIAENLRPVIKTLVAQRDPADLPAARQQDDDPNQPPPDPARPGITVSPDVQARMPGLDLDQLDLNLRGEVSIQIVGNQLVVIGAQEDVERVMRLIAEIERTQAPTVPELRMLMLRHVDSEALAELLTSVYAALTTARGPRAADFPPVNVIPVVKPNAVIILAAVGDVESVVDLATQLDRPVDPEREFQIFRLRNAPATQVATTIDTFYQNRPGLGVRVRVIPDVRTNSVVVQARPRDMEEVEDLIRKVDSDQSEAVSKVRFFPLRNALADDLAFVINQAIQSVLNPPQQLGAAGVLGAVGVGAVGAGQAAQQMQEVKSTVLEFLTDEEGRQRSIRSGILADIRVTAEPRTNKLVVTAPERSMDLMAELIRQLDVPTAAVAEIKIFTLSRADATRMAQLLQTLFAPEVAPGQLGIQFEGDEEAGSALIPLRFSVDVRTNSVIAVGGPEALNRVEAILFRLDANDIRQRQTEVIRLKNSPADAIAFAVNDYLQAQRDLFTLDPQLMSPFEQIEREVIVVPELVSNRLVISATPRFFEEIRQLVAELDAAPQQVIVQVMLVEVTLDNNEEFGVELGFQDSLLFDRSIRQILETINLTSVTPGGVTVTEPRIIAETRTPGFNFVNSPLGVNTAVHPAAVGTQGFGSFGMGRINGDLGFGGLVLSASSESVHVLIRALAQQRRTEVLSRPQIRTLDNQTGTIRVIQLVPTVTGVIVNQLGFSTPNIEMMQAGIILQVTPRISPDGIIVMQVSAEKSGISPAGVTVLEQADGTAITSPVFDQTTALATVAVPNNQTIVLGGLITKTKETLERKVPWLGDIPILGIPFRYDSMHQRRTELLIFLTPRIIRNDAENEMIKQIEAERIHFTEKDVEAIHGPIYGVPADMDLKMPASQFDAYGNPSLLDADDVPTTIMPAPAPEPLEFEGAQRQWNRDADGVQHASGTVTGGRQRTQTNNQPPAKKPNWSSRLNLWK